MLMNRMRKFGLLAATIIVMAIGMALVSPASPAHAATCTRGGNSAGATGGIRWAICRGAFDTFRVVIRCVENSGASYLAGGPWRGSGGQSSARCHEFAYLAEWGELYQ